MKSHYEITVPLSRATLARIDAQKGPQRRSDYISVCVTHSFFRDGLGIVAADVQVSDATDCEVIARVRLSEPSATQRTAYEIRMMLIDCGLM